MTNSNPDIIPALGELPPGSLITIGGLAQLFHRHTVSIKRAVARGELPPPCRLLGQPTWTVGVLLRHLEKRLDREARTAARINHKIIRLSP